MELGREEEILIVCLLVCVYVCMFVGRYVQVYEDMKSMPNIFRLKKFSLGRNLYLFNGHERTSRMMSHYTTVDKY